MLINNIEKIQSLLSNNMQAILLTSCANRQYALGAIIEEGMFLVTKEECIFFTDGRYYETSLVQLESIRTIRVGQEHTYYDYLIEIKEYIDNYGIRSLGIEEDNISHSFYECCIDYLGVNLIGCQRNLSLLRQIKEEWELNIMCRAQQITDSIFLRVLGTIQEGMKEKDLEAELIYQIYRSDAAGVSFAPVVVSGPNTSNPHGLAGFRRIRNGDFITMDFGVKYNGYCSDMTRTVAFGYATDKMRGVYNAVLSAQQAGISYTCAGRTGYEIDKFARQHIIEAGYGEFFCHNYGHSLGIEIHESPYCCPSNVQPMSEGNVLSAEPGIYIPGEFGVRIEDVVIVRKAGCTDITNSDKTLIVL